MLRYFFIVAVWLVAGPAVAAEKAPGLEQLLDGIEQRYAGTGFTADFFQESMLKAMQITDTAEGRLIVSAPTRCAGIQHAGRSRSSSPTAESMWIYRPADQQVMVGKAPEFFGRAKAPDSCPISGRSAKASGQRSAG
jgi:outer membrane lipoprotein carrier protein